MLTRAKVCYDLYKTPYKHDIEYEDQTITYHFSSELYKTKFIERHSENRRNISDSLWNRFNMRINVDALADLRLYSSIEKRGYLISVNGDYVTCQNNITFDGLKLMQKSLQDQ